MPRGKKTIITCACGCGNTKEVRTADVERGWGKYLNKAHKQKHQEEKKKVWNRLSGKKPKKGIWTLNYYNGRGYWHLEG